MGDARKRGGDGGFTLVELMVVIVIMGGLAALVTPNVIGALDRADHKRGKTQLAMMANAVSSYYIEHRRLPDSLEELTEPDPKLGAPFMDGIPKDPWGTPYELERDGRQRFRIRSCGKDRAPGTDDDLVWPFDVNE